MKRLLFAFAFLLAINFISFVAVADVTVEASVDRNELEPSDVLIYTVTITSTEAVNLSEPRLAKMNNFAVINEWTSEERRAVMIQTPQGGRDFRTLRAQKYNFQLQPRTEGLLSIGASQVEVDGRTYVTKPITVKVIQGANRGVRPSQPNMQPGVPPQVFEDEPDPLDLFQQLLRERTLPQQGHADRNFNPNEAFQIRVEVDKQEAYVSEQVTANWYLYTRGAIRDIDTLKYPSLKGFWKEDIELATQLNFTEEIINGVTYRKALLASYALFPIRAGVAVVDSYTAKCSVLVGDPFSGFASKIYQFTKSSPPIKITVKELPTEGRPTDFSGAVGQFQVSASVGTQAVVANQPFVFKIRFDGRGNAKLIDIPPFQPPEGVELYDTQKDAKFFKTGASYKEFNISMIARKEGQLTIPSIGVSIFDPNLKKYVSRSTEPVVLNVQKGQGGLLSSSPLATGAGGVKPRNAFPVIQTEWTTGPSLSASRALSVYGVCLFFCIGFLLVHARREFGWGQKKKNLANKLKIRMRKVRAMLAQDQWRAVGSEVTNICSLILGEIVGERGADVELPKLFAKMPPSLRQELALPVSALMDKFQALTFAPAEVVGSLKERSNLEKLVNEFEQQMQKSIRLSQAAET